MIKKTLILSFLLVGSSIWADVQKRPSDYFLDYEKEVAAKVETTDIQPTEEKTKKPEELSHIITKKPIAQILKNKILEKAKEFLGTTYGLGHKNPTKTDCSGFTQQVFSKFDISLPRSAVEQAAFGSKVSVNDLQVGDLLFYRTYKKEPSHVAIYAGNGKIIHASFRSRKVQYDDIDKGYYKQRFLYAKRLSMFNSDNSES